jgi:two-component system NtrC family sensor kinase
MKKTFPIVLLLTITPMAGYTQSNVYDSLKAVLERTDNQMEKFDALNRLSLELVGWRGDNVDSIYSTQMLQIAQKLKNDSLLAISYNWLGSYFYLNKGDNATALEYLYKAIPYAERFKDKRRLSSLYFDIALVYFDLLDNEEAMLATKKGAQYLPDKSNPLYDFMLIQYVGNMADYFIRINKVDSVFHYAKQLESAVERIGSSYLATVLVVQGAANAMAGNMDEADEYFNQALPEVEAMSSTNLKLQFYTYYIPFLFNTNRISDAEQQSRILLKLGTDYTNNNLKLAGAGLLRQIFDLKNEIDSAYRYSRMEASISAEIFSQNNRNRIQALSFNDQIRAIEEKAKEDAYRIQLKLYGLLVGLSAFLIIAFILYRNNRQKQNTNKLLEATLSNLKSTQAQLIQSEKMASLGELTAGIAHEIQNPLNFVNNFSDLNMELAAELMQEIGKGNYSDALDLAKDIKANEEKINHHGKRADAIVKGMLAHSRSGKGEKVLTNINALAEEYLKLSFHGLRAKDKKFNADFKTDFDPDLPEINLVPQDMGRVLLNLINNAFQAVNGFRDNPLVTVSTKKLEKAVEIRVTDNGPGIPDAIKDKIFQPFFTTKPTGQGTGLGLSLSYDIVKAHGGELKLETAVNTGTTFIIKLSV